MKYTAIILLLMSSLTLSAQHGKAVTEKKTFSRTTSISQTIKASPAVVWSILTNASDFPHWNSTVISLDGAIKEGEKIRLKSTLDPNRTFKLKVKEMRPDQKMVWAGSLGKRTYTLVKQDSGTLFTMTEKIGSFMFPLFANKIPSFDDAFEQFTSNLKTEAERKAKS